MQDIKNLSSYDLLSSKYLESIFSEDDKLERASRLGQAKIRAKELGIGKEFNDACKVYSEICDFHKSSVDSIDLDVNRQGEVKQSLNNCLKVLRFDSTFTGMLAYNQFTDKLEVHKSWWDRPYPFLHDLDISYIWEYLENKYGLNNRLHIQTAVQQVCHENSYHPVRDFLENLTWDHQDYISNLYPIFLGAEKSEYVSEVTKIQFLQAIERVFHPGAKTESVTVLIDKNQGSGKSTMCRLLAINDDWFTDDIKRIDDENIVRSIQGHWIIELPEMLVTSKAKSVEEIKSFISRQKDVYKVPYDKYPVDYYRQCVFIGTTNNIECLPADPTGNRRFLPIKCDKKKAEHHPLECEEKTREYILKCWAQAMDIYKSGNYGLVLPESLSSEADSIRKSFTPEDADVGIIQEWLDSCGKKSVCVLMIWKEAFRYLDKPSLYESKKISKIMDNLIVGWERAKTGEGKRRFSDYGKQVCWDYTGDEKESQFMEVPCDTDLPFE